MRHGTQENEMHRLNIEGNVMGVAGAFAAGVARHRMRRQAYVEAVQEGRRQDAQRRQVARLVAALDQQTARADAVAAQAVAARILRGLRD